MTPYFTGALWTYFVAFGAGLVVGLWFSFWIETIGRLYDDFTAFVEHKRKGQTP